MNAAHVFSPAQLDTARKMRRADIDWTAIGKFFGVDRLAIRRLIDPEWAELRRARVRAWDRKRSPRAKVAKAEPEPREEPAPQKPTRAEIMAARRHIPQEDTRNLTALFFGDPLPGQSALDKRNAATIMEECQ